MHTFLVVDVWEFLCDVLNKFPTTFLRWFEATRRFPLVGQAKRYLLNLNITTDTLHATYLKCHPQFASLVNVNATHVQSAIKGLSCGAFFLLVNFEVFCFSLQPDGVANYVVGPFRQGRRCPCKILANSCSKYLLVMVSSAYCSSLLLSSVSNSAAFFRSEAPNFSCYQLLFLLLSDMTSPIGLLLQVGCTFK